MVTIGEGKIAVSPGADYKEALVMNQWFPFVTPGGYSVTSQLTSDIESEDGSFRAESETSQLNVNPRDPVRLNKICEQLTKEVETAPNADAAQEPALTLSYVDDEIAVPYLVRVLATNTLTQRFAVAGLERIGNDAAVEVLLSTLNNNQNADAAQLATGALSRMEERIANPHLKETVKKAVERSSERARNEFIKTQIAYLDYRSPDLQRTAIQNLMQAQDGLQQAEPVLQRLANDSNQPAEVRAAAQDALKKLHPNN
jgi:hypothetical protein